MNTKAIPAEVPLPLDALQQRVSGKPSKWRRKVTCQVGDCQARVIG